MPSFKNSALFLLAVPALLLQGANANFSDTHDLGQCTGAKCGGWGDPHLITCDGLAYDCQGMGIFTLMENHVFNVQATFVDVGTEEKAQTAHWLTEGATITNDMMIEYLPDPTTPVVQFSFGDIAGFENEENIWPAENGCHIKSYYHEKLWDQGASYESNVQECRARCESVDDCDKFTYWYDGVCYLHPWWANRYWTGEGYTRAIAGDIDGDCGILTAEEEELMTLEQNAKSTRIGRGCPLLMFLDGEMIDISEVNYEGDLYGEKGDDVYAELFWGYKIHVTYKLEGGDYAVVELIQEGYGLGELWSCHWDFWICLPESMDEQFAAESIGLLGSPDGNTQNDWMTTQGEVLDFHDADINMLNYCYDNWCVGHDESLMTYHGDKTYEDYKCEEEEYIEIVDRVCVINIDKIEEACQDMPPLMIHPCEVDCCFGGCGQIEEVLEEIINSVTLSEKAEDVIYDIPTFEDCKGEDFDDTSDEVCGDEVDVVTLLKISGSEELPEGDIFYGITLDEEPSSEIGEQTVRFKVNNPFPDTADVYVKYEKAVENDFADPHCAKMIATPSGCDSEAVDIEVLCREFEGVEPFALVQVYFVSETISSEDSPSVDNCCEPESYGSEYGTVSYTFEVQCGCPPDSTA